MGVVWQSWIRGLVVCGVVLLYAPALLSFFTHVTEHAWPLGFARLLPGQVSPLPTKVALVLVWLAERCVAPTWCGMVLALLAGLWLRLSMAVRGGLSVLSALAFVSMRGMDAVLHSCWGEAPHAFWFAFRY
jgi:hypothetical protein